MYGKMQNSGLIEITPLMYISALWVQYPVPSHSVLSGWIVGGLATGADGSMRGVLFLFQVSSGQLSCDGLRAIASASFVYSMTGSIFSLTPCEDSASKYHCTGD